jgi:hypothetical protein
MPSKTLVMIYDQDDNKHGEISVMENPQKAARLVETLLEAGFARERIRVFTGDEMGLQVTHRPVVALVEGGAPPTGETTEEAPASESETEQEEVAAPTKAEREELTVASSVPFIKDGVRFSTAFRPA